MKQNLIRLMALLLCLTMAAALVACAKNDGTTEPAGPGSATADGIDPDTVVATIGDTYTVTYQDLAEYYSYYMDLMSYYGYGAPETDAEIEELQDALLQDYINNKKQYYYADLYGIALSEEDARLAREEADEEMAYYMEEFTEMAKEEGLQDEAAVAARAKELFAQDLATYGIEMSPEEYADYVYGQIAEEKRLSLLQDYVNADIHVTDADVEALFTSMISEQSAVYQETPLYYMDDVESFEKGEGTPVLYTPEGFFRVKVLYVEPEGTLDEGYAEMLERLEELEAEYGALALEDEAGNAARLKEIRQEYTAIRQETEDLYEDYTAAARTRAEEIYAKLEAGEAFDALLQANGTDQDYARYEQVGKNGKLMYRDGGDGWEDSLRETALSLTPGTYSGVIKVDDAYCIVYLVGEEPSGPASLDSIREEVAIQALTKAREEHYASVLAEWELDDSMVTYFRDAYRGIGKK